MSSHEDYHIGEDAGIDMRQAAAERAEMQIISEKSNNVFMDLGEHGEVYTSDIERIEADETAGHLRIYLRHAKDPRVITVAVVALGIVLGGLAHGKYRKK